MYIIALYCRTDISCCR